MIINNKVKVMLIKNSRKLGYSASFSRVGSAIHVSFSGVRVSPQFYVDSSGELRLRTSPICENGMLNGRPLRYDGDDAAEFERICDRWYKAYIRG